MENFRLLSDYLLHLMLLNRSPEYLTQPHEMCFHTCFKNRDYKCQVQTLEYNFLKNVLILNGLHYITTSTELFGNHLSTNSHVHMEEVIRNAYAGTTRGVG